METNEDLEIGLLQMEAELTETQAKLKALKRSLEVRCADCIHGSKHGHGYFYVACQSYSKNILDPKWSWNAAYGIYPKDRPRQCDFFVSKEKYGDK